MEQTYGAADKKSDDASDAITTDVDVQSFDPSRGRLVLEFFIRHYISLAKKSNEFSSHGQSLMYIYQAENLMRLLSDLNLSGAAQHMGFHTELEQLKQVSRGTAKDYWNISWDVGEMTSNTRFVS